MRLGEHPSQVTLDHRFRRLVSRNIRYDLLRLVYWKLCLEDKPFCPRGKDENLLPLPMISMLL